MLRSFAHPNFALSPMTDKLSAADFESLPNREITASFGATDVALEVTEVRALTPTPFRAAPFSVTLRHNGASQYAPQGTYIFHHPTRGELLLFTNPRGPDGKGMCYQVIFN